MKHANLFFHLSLTWLAVLVVCIACLYLVLGA
jgi:hypothetical protein